MLFIAARERKKKDTAQHAVVSICGEVKENMLNETCYSALTRMRVVVGPTWERRHHLVVAALCFHFLALLLLHAERVSAVDVEVVPCNAPELTAHPVFLRSDTTYRLTGCTVPCALIADASASTSLSAVAVYVDGGTALPCVWVHNLLLVQHVVIVIDGVHAASVCASPYISSGSEFVGNASLVDITATRVVNATVRVTGVTFPAPSSSTPANNHSASPLQTVVTAASYVNATHLIRVEVPDYANTNTNPNSGTDSCAILIHNCRMPFLILGDVGLAIRATLVTSFATISMTDTFWNASGRYSGTPISLRASGNATNVQIFASNLVVHGQLRPELIGDSNGFEHLRFIEVELHRFAQHMSIVVTQVSWSLVSAKPFFTRSSQVGFFVWILGNPPSPNIGVVVEYLSVQVEDCNVSTSVSTLSSVVTLDRLERAAFVDIAVHRVAATLMCSGATVASSSSRAAAILLFIDAVIEDGTVSMSDVSGTMWVMAGAADPADTASAQQQAATMCVMLTGARRLNVFMQDVRMHTTIHGGTIQPYAPMGGFAGFGDAMSGLFNVNKKYPVVSLTLTIRRCAVRHNSSFSVNPALYIDLYLSTLVAVNLITNCTRCNITVLDTSLYLEAISFPAARQSTQGTISCGSFGGGVTNSFNLTSLVNMFDMYHEIALCPGLQLPAEAQQYLPPCFLELSQIYVQGCSVRTTSMYAVSQPMDSQSVMSLGKLAEQVEVTVRSTTLAGVSIDGPRAGARFGASMILGGPFGVVCLAGCALVNSRISMKNVSALVVVGRGAATNNGIGPIAAMFRFFYSASALRNVTVSLRDVLLGIERHTLQADLQKNTGWPPLLLDISSSTASPIPTTLSLLSCVFTMTQYMFIGANFSLLHSSVTVVTPTPAQLPHPPTPTQVILYCGVLVEEEEEEHGARAVTLVPITTARWLTFGKEHWMTRNAATLAAIASDFICPVVVVELLPPVVGTTASASAIGGVLVTMILSTVPGAGVTGLGAISTLQASLGALSIRRRCGATGGSYGNSENDRATIEVEPALSNGIDNPLQLSLQQLPQDLQFAGGAVIGNSVFVCSLGMAAKLVLMAKHRLLKRAVRPTTRSRPVPNTSIRQQAQDQRRRGGENGRLVVRERVGSWFADVCQRIHVSFPGLLIVPYAALVQPVTVGIVLLLRHQEGGADAKSISLSVLGGMVMWLVAVPLRLFWLLCVRFPLGSRSTPRGAYSSLDWMFVPHETYRCGSSSSRRPKIGDFSLLQTAAQRQEEHAHAAAFLDQYVMVFGAFRAPLRWFGLVEITFSIACGLVTGVALAEPLAASSDSVAKSGCSPLALSLMWVLAAFNAAQLLLYIALRPHTVPVDSLQSALLTMLSFVSIVLSIYERDEDAAGIDAFLALWTLAPIALEVVRVAAPESVTALVSCWRRRRKKETAGGDAAAMVPTKRQRVARGNHATPNDRDAVPPTLGAHQQLRKLIELACDSALARRKEDEVMRQSTQH